MQSCWQLPLATSHSFKSGTGRFNVSKPMARAVPKVWRSVTLINEIIFETPYIFKILKQRKQFKISMILPNRHEITISKHALIFEQMICGAESKNCL